MNKEDKKKQGKKNRKAGKDFEKKVRAHLEKEWIVAKFSNNVEFVKIVIETAPGMFVNSKNIKVNEGKLIQAKAQYNPFFKRIVGEGSGFPDFIAYKIVSIKTPVGEIRPTPEVYDIIGVECKRAKYLNKEEKEKCKWLLEHHIFSKIFIASPSKEKGKINLEEFKNASRNL
jgi:hypothetical protein